MAGLAELLQEDCVRSLARSGPPSLAPLRGATLVVTGGTGFVGLWLTTFCAYLNDTHNFGIKLFLTGRRRSRLAEAAPHLAQRSDIRFLQSDIRQTIDIPAEADFVIHAAANPDSRFHAVNPLETMDVIASGTYRVLRAVEQCRNLQMFLNLSSASVYGGQPAGMAALAEDHVGPVDSASTSSAYSEAKRFGETLCASARSQSRTPVITARPFTFVGPFQSLDAPWAMNNFLHAALHGQPLKIFGSGETRRSYLYGSDVAFLLLRILSAGQSGNVFNVGNAQDVSLAELAQTVTQLAGRLLDIRVNTAREKTSPTNLVPDMTRVKEALDFTSAIPLAHAIDRALAWNRSLHSLVI